MAVNVSIVSSSRIYSCFWGMMKLLVVLSAILLMEKHIVISANAQSDVSYDAAAPAAGGVDIDECTGAMEELSACNATSLRRGVTSPAGECCDALRSIGPECMCSVFLGPSIPNAAQLLNISRDQALLLPRSCNLARIRCSAPPSSPSSSSSLRDSNSIVILGADNDSDDANLGDDEEELLNGEWPEEAEDGY
ncbi:hypothetical protein KP509_02G080100 [Ceratopteris richardii]|uniref:Bifunctional inhibitor/plant lipid transfer protein/seed storage helical domain-containing protein n=1 Tax=Ceratopteris richardii TaxID=49495 RepID=A0A8T2V7L7_CERRI|nr:hypothetical protein KP509_02G080100 [Ceratopteris richardii]